jgi:hypothetical protein
MWEKKKFQKNIIDGFNIMEWLKVILEKNIRIKKFQF